MLQTSTHPKQRKTVILTTTVTAITIAILMAPPFHLKPPVIFWQELQQSVEQIIHLDQHKKVIVSPNASLLTVRAYPSELKQVEQYINSSIASLQRQVIIEAKIIEVTLNDKYEQGIDWSYFLGGTSKTPGTSGSVQLGGSKGLDLFSPKFSIPMAILLPAPLLY